MDTQFVFAAFTLVGSVAIAWGVSVNKLKALEIRMGIVEGEHKADHDLLIRLDEKVSLILKRLDSFTLK